MRFLKVVTLTALLSILASSALVNATPKWMVAEAKRTETFSTYSEPTIAQEWTFISGVLAVGSFMFGSWMKSQQDATGVWRPNDWQMASGTFLINALIGGMVWMLNDQGEDIIAVGRPTTPTTFSVYQTWPGYDTPCTGNEAVNTPCAPFLEAQEFNTPGLHTITPLDSDNSIDVVLSDGSPYVEYYYEGDLYAPARIKTSKYILKGSPSGAIDASNWVINGKVYPSDPNKVDEWILFENPMSYLTALNVSDTNGAHGISTFRNFTVVNGTPDLTVKCNFSNKKYFPIILVCRATATPKGFNVAVDNYEWQINGESIQREVSKQFSFRYDAEAVDGLTVTVQDERGMRTSKNYEIKVNPDYEVSFEPLQ